MICGETIWPQINQISVEEELKNIIDFLDKGTYFLAFAGALLS